MARTWDERFTAWSRVHVSRAKLTAVADAALANVLRVVAAKEHVGAKVGLRDLAELGQHGVDKGLHAGQRPGHRENAGRSVG